MSYRLKHTYFQGREVAVCLQNMNGPCPLLAIINVLSLYGRVTFGSEEQIVSAATLFGHICRLLKCVVPQSSEFPPSFEAGAALPSPSAPLLSKNGLGANETKVMNDAMDVLPKLQSGIDLNVRFSGIMAFEYTSECSVFDLLRVPLVHGWLMDERPGAEKLTKLSYNQMVEKAISCDCLSPPASAKNSIKCDNENSVKTEQSSKSKEKSGTKEQKSGLALHIEADNDVLDFICADFLRDTASQLTQTGLQALRENLEEEQLCVFFRNNHFSTLYKKLGRLFLLVTDEGYGDFPDIVWESLESVNGDTCYVDITLGLRPYITLPVATPATDVSLSNERASVEGQESDEALARRLQAEESAEAQKVIEQREVRKLAEERASAQALVLERSKS